MTMTKTVSGDRDVSDDSPDRLDLVKAKYRIQLRGTTSKLDDYYTFIEEHSLETEFEAWLLERYSNVEG
jgi:hypothetical protein